MEHETLDAWVAAHAIRVEIQHDRGAQVDDRGWEHHAYVLRVGYGTVRAGAWLNDIPWRQGYGIETSPSDTPVDVVAALIDDAWSYLEAGSFEDWAANFGYDTDSLSAYRIHETLGPLSERVRVWVESTGDSFDDVATLERP